MNKSSGIYGTWNKTKEDINAYLNSKDGNGNPDPKVEEFLAAILAHLDELAAHQQQQDNRMTAIEQKNIEQDVQIEIAKLLP